MRTRELDALLKQNEVPRHGGKCAECLARASCPHAQENGAAYGGDVMQEITVPKTFDPETLHGLSFIDGATGRRMRYIYPDAGHWCAGWIVTQNPSGEWMTWRKATDADIAAINQAVAESGTTMNSELVAVYLELIAAKAKQLSEDVKRGRTWEGDVSRGIAEISETLQKVAGEARNDR